MSVKKISIQILFYSKHIFKETNTFLSKKRVVFFLIVAVNFLCVSNVFIVSNNYLHLLNNFYQHETKFGKKKISAEKKTLQMFIENGFGDQNNKLKYV